MKLRAGLMLGTAFVIGLGAGVLMMSSRPAMSQADPNSDVYQQLGLFSDIFGRVKADYVVPEKSEKLVYDAINGMLTGLDPHSGYMNKKQYADMQVETTGEFGGLGLEVSEFNGFIKVITPIDDTPAAKAGIKPGDLIVDIDKKTTDGLDLNKAVDEMRGKVGSQITLTIKRAHVDTPITVTLTREIIQVQAVKSKLYGDIGYIRLASFSEQADQDIRKAVAKLQDEAHGNIKGYVLDLRNNPGGLLDQGIAVADDFLNSGEIVSTHGRHSQDDEVWYAHPGDITNGAPIVVMVNAGSASAAEIVTAALQQNRRAVVLGTRSFGKGSVQTIFQIPGGGAMRLTTALYYTPSGKSIQDYGVQPDVKVAETRTPQDNFPDVHEADLAHAFQNPSGLKAPILPPPLTLPAAAKSIPDKPPANWPKFDPTKPSTDFQLQQALKLTTDLIASPATPGAAGTQAGK